MLNQISLFKFKKTAILLASTAFIITAYLTSNALAAENAPGFNLPTLDGKISSEELKGKIVYLDFWASWCVPCRKSFPWMNEMQTKYSDLGFTVVAINLDEERENVDKFLNKYNANFPIALDPKGESAQAFKVKGMPSSYLIDRNGAIQKSHIGFRSEDKEELEHSISNLLKQ